jgi:hypothetical protein
MRCLTRTRFFAFRAKQGFGQADSERGPSRGGWLDHGLRIGQAEVCPGQDAEPARVDDILLMAM